MRSKLIALTFLCSALLLGAQAYAADGVLLLQPNGANKPWGGAGNAGLIGGSATATAPTIAEGAPAALSLDLRSQLRIALPCISGESDCNGIASGLASFLMVAPSLPRITVPVTGVTTNTTSATFTLPHGAKTIVTKVEGTGAVAQTITLFGTYDSTATLGESLCVMTATGTTKAIISCATQVTKDYPRYYVVSTGTTGTGATGEMTVLNGLVAAGGAGGGGGAVTNAGTFAVQNTAATPAGTSLIGKVGIDQTTPGATNAVQAIAGTTGGANPCYLASAATTNATNCKATGGTLYGYELINTTATLYYVRLYNLAAAPTCSSATGFIRTIPVPASATGAGVVRDIAVGEAYGTGIGFCVTGGSSSTDNTNAAVGVYLSLLYK